jgi:hypothetical protein
MGQHLVVTQTKSLAFQIPATCSRDRLRHSPAAAFLRLLMNESIPRPYASIVVENTVPVRLLAISSIPYPLPISTIAGFVERGVAN